MSNTPLVPADVEQILEANEPKVVPDSIDTLGGKNPRDEAAGCPTGLQAAPAPPQQDEAGQTANAKKQE